jgi:hypothetical protein
VRIRVLYEGPPEGAQRLADELRAVGFIVANGPPLEHPDIRVEEARVVLWVSIESEPGVGRSLRQVRAFVSRLVNQYPNTRVEIDEVPD